MNEILVTSLVGYKTGEPLVELAWGDQKGQLSSAEARAHAYRILQAADAAESDLFIWRFMTDTIGVSTDAAARVITEFRKFRDARRPSS